MPPHGCSGTLPMTNRGRRPTGQFRRLGHKPMMTIETLQMPWPPSKPWARVFMALWILPVSIGLGAAGLSPQAAALTAVASYLLVAVPILMRLSRSSGDGR